MPALPDGSGKTAEAITFRDPDVAAAYTRRPPYPESLIRRLAGLVDGHRVVLDLGCGTGDIARPLSRHVTAVHAVDPSEAMIEIGKSLHRSADGRIDWYLSTAEAFDFPAEYGLVVAGESFHWMRWPEVVPRIHDALSPGGCLALVGRVERAPWQDAMRAFIPTYSMVKNFVAVDVAVELENAGLAECIERATTEFEPFRQSIDDYIELQHSRAAFARYRMPAEDVRGFDDALRQALAPHATAGHVTYEIAAGLDVLRPRAARPVR